MVRKGDVLNPSCPSREVLERIGEKWTALVIRVLADGTHRYSDLQRRVGGVSQKMLTQTVRGLERDGLVVRRVFPVVPPRVEYSLTPLGRTLIEPLDAVCRWAERHLPEMLAARARSGKAAAERRTA
ncbi:MAG TPA: helix-turn-helix domain-containing protein [Vicinamibacteria bacterium]|nr:helix-turn-helix domain-containing protein [Vicinamibacteria bacterium]